MKPAIILSFMQCLTLVSSFAFSSLANVIPQYRIPDSPQALSSFSSDEVSSIESTEDSNVEFLPSSPNQQHVAALIASSNDHNDFKHSNLAPVSIKLGSALVSLLMIGVITADENICSDNRGYWVIKSILGLLAGFGFIELMIGLGFSVYVLTEGEKIFSEQVCSKKTKFNAAAVLLISDLVLAFTKFAASATALGLRDDVCPSNCARPDACRSMLFPEYWAIAASSLNQILFGIMLVYIFSKI